MINQSDKAGVDETFFDELEFRCIMKKKCSRLTVSLRPFICSDNDLEAAPKRR